MNKNLKFPKGFLWGASTSAYQIEGGIDNCDWAKVFPAGAACDHYNRYEDDFDLVKNLNQNAHRFSIEWSRIEPEEGKFDQKEIEHYQKVILALKKRGIKPFVGLWHWTNPLWISNKGGWESKETIKYFSRYVDKVSSSLKDTEFWITINEPELFAFLSYVQGKWPPKKKNFISFLKVINNLIEAHKKAYEVIKKIQPDSQIGIATNNSYYEASKNDPIAFLAKNIVESLDYFYILNKIRNYQDFIGLNYYFHSMVKGFKFNQNDNKIVSDMGWEIYPKGIYYVLKKLKKYNKPIYITENGVADAKDILRKDFIRNHLYWVYKTIEDGVDVKGYLYWSLLDNFEWDKGFWPRFGLIKINYKTMERKIRNSALEYAKICRQNSLDYEKDL